MRFTRKNTDQLWNISLSNSRQLDKCDDDDDDDGSDDDNDDNDGSSDVDDE